MHDADARSRYCLRPYPRGCARESARGWKNADSLLSKGKPSHAVTGRKRTSAATPWVARVLMDRLRQGTPPAAWLAPKQASTGHICRHIDSFRHASDKGPGQSLHQAGQLAVCSILDMSFATACVDAGRAVVTCTERVKQSMQSITRPYSTRPVVPSAVMLLSTWCCIIISRSILAR